MWGTATKQKGDGRVMIDRTSFASTNPDYPMGNARAPASSTYIASSSSSSSFARVVGRQYVEDNREEDCDLTGEEFEEASEDSLIFAPAFVYGFLFELKEWGSFAVCGLSDIAFSTGAFEELTMDPGKQLLIHNLVAEYICPTSDSSRVLFSRKRARVDPIAKKGEGCTFLCYGPPGIGKTLAAESVAEKMKQSMWSLSVSELSTNPGSWRSGS